MSEHPPAPRIESGVPGPQRQPAADPAPVGDRIEPRRVEGRIDSGALRQPTVDPRAPLSQGAAESDRRLAASVESAIDRASGLSDAARDIEVTAINGRVTLRGSVADAAELDRVRRLASDLAGADRVNLDLRLSGR